MYVGDEGLGGGYGVFDGGFDVTGWTVPVHVTFLCVEKEVTWRLQ